jgi:hypothetical protein
MSRQVDPAAAVVVVAGVWERVIAERIVAARRQCVDPRVAWVTDDPAEQERLNDESPIVQMARRRLVELEGARAAGAAVTVHRTDLTARDFPELQHVPWIADRWLDVDEVRIGADDTVQPAVHHHSRPQNQRIQLVRHPLADRCGRP